jgi:hypothetical protein
MLLLQLLEHARPKRFNLDEIKKQPVMGWFSNEYCGERNVSLTYLRVLEVKQLYKVEGLIRYQSPD